MTNVQSDTIFLDLSKALDSAPHDLLLHKIYGYGISGNLLIWIHSYLKGQRQLVAGEGAKYSTKPILSGVPQGSILGCLLFIMYINDLPDVMDLDR